MDIQEIIKRVEKTWDNYRKNTPELIEPMLKGMPKKCKPYFLKFFKTQSYGYVSNDLDYTIKFLGLMGISVNDASAYYWNALYENY